MSGPAVSWGRVELLWLAAAAPFAAWAVVWVVKRRLRAVASWAQPALWDRLLPALAGGKGARRAIASSLCFALLIVALALALARPRWGERREVVERRGIDIVFVLDSSLSMAARDVAPSRLTLAASLVRRMARELPGNRLGIVQTEGDSVVLAPLTTDAGVIDLVLDTVEPGSLPLAGSRLADGLRKALTLYPPGDDKHRALVLLSDGEDHGGAIDETVAALKEQHVILHAIGLGTRSGGPLPLPGGAENEFKQDRAGRVVVSKLEPEALSRLASGTGGSYLEVDRSNVDPQPILAALRSMEGRTLDEENVTSREERFQWPLFGAALALLAYLMVSPLRA